MTQQAESELRVLNAELLPTVPLLDLHGESLGEAETILESFLNQQFCIGERVIKIIHGKGSGILKQFCQQALSGHPLIEYVGESSQPYEQGAVTYAVLVPR